ncbi:hypothetical protein PC41400_25110 [Paenibacillus chitinolyticus]|uniref:Uncharacterized protein n=1 Tax=Paenibacillus chitinolyticus TaxID=79263 RepID=A0A410X2E3_9BACL|nr:hypothetical protein PC41400_25110 [Paenibacillus chitinolyticus]
MRLPEADRRRFFLSPFPRPAFALFFLPPIPFGRTTPAFLLFAAAVPDAFFSPAVRLFFTRADLAPVFLFMVALAPSPQVIRAGGCRAYALPSL